MRITSLYRLRFFTLCCGAVTRDIQIQHPNKEAGEYTQYLYLIHGDGVAASGAGERVFSAGELVDLSAFKGQEITYTSTTDMAAWVAFNPILPDTQLLVSVLTEPGQTVLLDTSLETYIVPIKGTVEVNGKTIEEFKSGRLLIGKEGNLTVPEGTICAIVKVTRGT